MYRILIAFGLVFTLTTQAFSLEEERSFLGPGKGDRDSFLVNLESDSDIGGINTTK